MGNKFLIIGLNFYQEFKDLPGPKGQGCDNERHSFALYKYLLLF